MSLPNWIHSRYLALADQYKEGSFGFEEAVKVLQKRFGDKEDQIKLVMSELRKAHFIQVERSDEDSRKKVYTLISLSDQKEKGKLTRGDIDKVLKRAADLIRTRVDYSFILLLLFYKRFSDQWNVEYRKAYQEAIKDKFSDKEADTEARKSAYHKINIPEEYSWEAIRKDTLKISENFSQAIKSLADLNPTLRETFQQFDFSDFTRNPENNEILRQLVELFSSYSFENVSPDILGDAYEWILRYFAPQKAKEGEVYTPREVIQLMVELLDPQQGESVYDPAAGSSGMLIAAYKHVEEKHSKAKADSLFLYGQEQNPKTLSLAKMNLLIHDITNGLMAQGDTLRFPKFKEGDSYKRFTHVLANPPWNQDGYDEQTLKQSEYWRDRFPYGFTSMQSADWAWVQHMLMSAKEKVAVILDSGAVSRGAREKSIRQKIVQTDLVDAVILLPEKLFYNTTAPGIILVLNKKKPKEREGKILLINASREYIQGRPLNSLSPENIRKISDSYTNFAEQDEFSRIISIEDASENEFNLSPSRYVSHIEKLEYPPLKELLLNSQTVDKEVIASAKRMEKVLEGLLVSKPDDSEANWEMVRLGDGKVATVKYGKAKPSETGVVPVYGSSGIYAYTNKPLIDKPTVVIGRKGSAGITYLADKPCWPSDTTFFLDINLEVINPKFLYFYISFKKLSGQHDKTTLPSLKREDLENLKVPLISLDEQEVIVHILEDIQSAIDKEEESIKKKKELFQATLDQLVRGGVSLKIK